MEKKKDFLRPKKKLGKKSLSFLFCDLPAEKSALGHKWELSFDKRPKI